MLMKSSRSTGSAAAAAAGAGAAAAAAADTDTDPDAADAFRCGEELEEEAGVPTAERDAAAAVPDVEIRAGRDAGVDADFADPVPPKSMAAILSFSLRCAAATGSSRGACRTDCAHPGTARTDGWRFDSREFISLRAPKVQM